MVRAADRVLERPEPEPGLGEEPAVLDEEPLQEAGSGLVQADVQIEPAHRISRGSGAGRLRHAKIGARDACELVLDARRTLRGPRKDPRRRFSIQFTTSEPSEIRFAATGLRIRLTCARGHLPVIRKR